MISLYMIRRISAATALLLILFGMFIGSTVHAQGLGQKSAIKLDSIMVEGDFEEDTETS